MRVLNVAEKPSMARQITLILSNGDFDSVNGKNKFCKNYIFKYEVRGQSTTMVMTSVLGHVKVLDFGPGYSDWQRVPVEELFSAPVIQDIPSKMQDVADNLRIEARKSEILIIWTDCDREGEYIGAEIAQICLSANSRLDIYRARYSVLNFTELSRSIRNLPRLDMRQVAAAELRSELDLRGGAAFTRLQTLCFRERQSELRDKIISYGSCQFPTLGFVVEQYLKIMNFVPEPFWSIQLELSQNGRITKFVWKRNRLFSRLMCLILYERCVEQGRALITKVESKPTSKWYHVVYLILTTRRPIPLRTVELQKFGSRYLKLSSDRVMEIAEKLYNQGYISYPRTETDMFENAFDLNSLIAKQQNHSTWGSYASNLLNGRFKFPRKGKNNDKAHPPIHPTKDGSGLVGAEAKVYEFVARRFLACCSDDAHGLETIVLARMGDEEFRARESLNYLEVYTYENWNDQAIGNFSVNESHEPSKVEMTSGTTTAPKLLSESELIGTMDKNGIGTDATIHEHIKKIIERSYVLKGAESRFHPTNLGLSLVVGYDHVGLEESLTKPKLRAQLETSLTDICEGRKGKDEVLQAMIAQFRSSLSATRNNIEVLHGVINANRHNGLFQPAPLNDAVDSSRRPAAGRGRRDEDDVHRPPPGDDDFDSDGNNNHRPRGGRSKKSIRSSTDSLDSPTGPSCPCKQPTRRKTTTKPGPNKGRDFWSCSQCNFFCWVGDEQNTAPREVTKNNSNTVCGCGKIAVKRIVSKDGPNKGRSFAVCPNPKDSACPFFSWLDEDPSNSSKIPQRSNSKFGHDEICQCGMVAVRDTAKSGANAGRAYYRCSKTVKRCGFWEWEDGNEGRASINKDSVDVTCYRCGQSGHFANACTNEPVESNEGTRKRSSRGRSRGRGRGSNWPKRRQISPKDFDD